MKTAWTIVLVVLLLGLSGLAASQHYADGLDRSRQRQVISEYRQRYKETGFCGYCGDSHWLSTPGTPKPCPICNPRGTLEVRNQ